MDSNAAGTSLDQPKTPEPEPTNTPSTRPIPSPRRQDTDKPLENQLRFKRLEVDRVENRIQAAVEEGREKTRRKVRFSLPEEDPRHPPLSITPILSQEEQAKQVPQALVDPLSDPQPAPVLEPQLNHSRLYHRDKKEFADPLRKPTLREALGTTSGRKKKSAPAKSKLLPDQPLLESVDYPKSTEAKKSTKPIKYGQGHPAFPKDKSTKLTEYNRGHPAFLKNKSTTSIRKIREEVKNQRKLARRVSEAKLPKRSKDAIKSGVGQLHQGSKSTINKLPGDTKKAIKADVKLQKQIISKTSFERTKYNATI